MTSLQFHEWVQQQRTACEQENKAPELISRQLIERLKNESTTWDKTIISSVNAWNWYESKNPNNAKPFGYAIELINEILELTQERNLLKASLIIKKAELYDLNGNSSESIKCYSQALEYLNPLQLDADAKSMQSMVTMGELLFVSNKKEQAEKAFLDVLSYPWYLIEEPITFQTMREYYIRAGMGLIECRRGNMVALKNTFFVPAANETLKPLLEKAIGDAGKNK